MSRERSSWPIRRYVLGQEPPDDLSASTTAEERIAMMWAMARDGWALAGRAMPAYRRSEMPSRLYRPGERRDDE